ncbi:hypothetical protein [Pyrococcus kukulkanii]
MRECEANHTCCTTTGSGNGRASTDEGKMGLEVVKTILRIPMQIIL